MTGAVHQAALMAPGELFLRLPDELHRAVETDERVGGG
jgi:hypothetical protein